MQIWKAGRHLGGGDLGAALVERELSRCRRCTRYKEMRADKDTFRV